MLMILNRKKYGTYSDLELIELLRKNGKKNIVGEIYKRYSHLVFGTAMKYLKNKDDAEDLLMDLFEKLPGKLQTNNVTNFKSWLYMVTKNECLMLLRKSKKEFPGILLDPADDQESFNFNTEKKLSLLEEAVEQLKDLQKICIKEFYIEGKSYNQLAEDLNIDVKKVKSAIQNGKRNIKLTLKEKDEFKEIK